MQTGVGYLTVCANPTFSGLANVVFRNTLVPCEETVLTRCHCEAGFGVRQLIAAVGANGRLTKESGEKLVAYAIDDFGLLTFVQPVDEEMPLEGLN